MPSISLHKRLGLIAFLLLMGTLFHYPVTIEEPPYGIHQWRQGDCLSITQNFYHEDRSLFDPRINNIADGEEDGLAEFPLIYYLDAQLMKLFGQSIAISKGTNILLVLTGFYFLFLALRRVLKDAFIAALIPLLVFCSPILIYYTNTTMLNVPALGIFFISAYFFVRFYEKGTWDLLLYASVLLSLAGLMRATMSIAGAPFYVIFILELLFGGRFGKGGRKFFPRSLLNGFILSIPVLLIGGWYGYAKYFNTVEGNTYFLMEPRSYFDVQADEVWLIATRLYHEHFQELFTQPVFIFLFIAFLNIVFFRRYFDKRLFTVTIAYAVPSALYFVLWYKNLFQHDYYLFDLFPFCISILVTIAYSFRHRYPEVSSSRAFRFSAILVLILGIYNGFVLQGKRFDISGTLMKKSFLLSKGENDFWNWFHDTNRHVHRLDSLTPQLRALGIKRDDPVISVPDPTPNHTLSLMDQKGFTQLFSGDKEGKGMIEEWIDQGAEYMVVHDPRYLDQHELGPYTKDRIGKYKDIRIYRLPDKKGAETGAP